MLIFFVNRLSEFIVRVCTPSYTIFSQGIRVYKNRKKQQISISWISDFACFHIFILAVFIGGFLNSNPLTTNNPIDPIYIHTCPYLQVKRPIVCHGVTNYLNSYCVSYTQRAWIKTIIFYKQQCSM